MERPVAERVGCEIKARSPARLDEHRMLARRAVALPRHQLEKMAVQVDRMAHHRIVDEVDPYPLALAEGNGLVIVGHLDAVERPHEAFHVAGQMDIERAQLGSATRREKVCQFVQISVVAGNIKKKK